MAVRRFAVLVLLLLLTACPGTQPPAELPPPTFRVDGSLTPKLAEIEGLEGGPSRPVSSLMDENGTQVDFVANELILQTSDEASLQAFLARWGGEVLDVADPGEAGLADAAPFYLIRVSAPTAAAEVLAADFARLVPEARGDFQLSSPAGLDLFGVFAAERLSGSLLTPNWVMEPQLESGPIREGASGIVKPGKAPPSGAPLYAADLYTWPYMASGGNQDIGVTAAWRALSLAGRFGNRVGIAIFDAGFLENADFPNTTNLGGWGKPNPASCSGSPCPFHGTGVASAAFGAAGNGYGAAGPAAPIARRIVVQSPHDFWSVVKYPFELLRTVAEGPRVINLSATFVLHAVPAAAAQPVMNAFSGLLRLAGVLVVVAAGNEGHNLDDRDCFVACWYKRTAFPCELGNVLCVGGMGWDSRDRDSRSNYGRNVDLFGPMYVWVVDAGSVFDTATLEGGTSLASPFVAGVAALVWAANPNLSAGEVEDTLMRTAHTRNGAGVGRAVNAASAVSAALGNVPPVIRLRANPVQVGLRQEVRLYSTTLTPAAGELFSVYDYEDAGASIIPNVRVTSDRDNLGVSSFHTFQSAGRRTLTITATDRAGAVSRATLTVDVVNTPPTITNVTAPESVGLAEGWSPITPVIATDPDEPGGRLPCSRVRWRVQGNDLPSPSIGCDTFVVFSEQGPREVTITATDPEGATGSRTLTVNVGPRPAQIRPSVSGFVVRDSSGAELSDLSEVDKCPLTATATIYNPDNAPVNLSWSLDDGTYLLSGELEPFNGGQSVRVNCGTLQPRRHFLQLFLPTTQASSAVKRFAFDIPLLGPR